MKLNTLLTVLIMTAFVPGCTSLSSKSKAIVVHGPAVEIQLASGLFDTVTAGRWTEEDGIIHLERRGDHRKFDRNRMGEEPLLISAKQYPAKGVVCEFEVFVVSGSLGTKVVFAPYPYESLNNKECPENRCPIVLGPRAGGFVTSALYRWHLTGRGWNNIVHNYDWSLSQPPAMKWVKVRSELINGVARIEMNDRVLLESRFDDIEWRHVNVAIGDSNTELKLRNIRIRPATESEISRRGRLLKKNITIGGKETPAFMPEPHRPDESNGPETLLTSLTPERIIGNVQIDRTPSCQRIRIDNKAYDRGLGLLPRARIVYKLDGKFSRLTGLADADLLKYTDILPSFGTRVIPDKQIKPVALVFYGDERELKRYTIKPTSAPEKIDLDVTNINQLTIHCESKIFPSWFHPPLVIGNSMLTKE